MTRKPNTDKLFNRLVMAETLITFNDHLIELSLFAEEFFKVSKNVKIKSINAFPLWSKSISPKRDKLVFSFKGLKIAFQKPHYESNLLLSVSLYDQCYVPYKPIGWNWVDSALTYLDYRLVKGSVDSLVKKRNTYLIILGIYYEKNEARIPPRPGSGEERYFREYHKHCKELREISLSLDYDKDGFFRGLVKSFSKTIVRVFN